MVESGRGKVTSELRVRDAEDYEPDDAKTGQPVDWLGTARRQGSQGGIGIGRSYSQV